MRSIRPEAPYLPSNIDYIAANNGLGDVEQVRGGPGLAECFLRRFLGVAVLGIL